MRKIELTKEKRERIREINERCRLKTLMESNMPEIDRSSIVVVVNDELIKMPKLYSDRL